MKDQKLYRILLALSCLAVSLVLLHGKVNASPVGQIEPDFDAIDAYVAEQVKNLGIPGLALGIIQDGEVAHLQGFGVADSSGRSVTPQTPFYIGSVTKSFTALAVMQLVEEGQIDLDAPVQTYLPWWSLADKEASATITVRHLLNQSSGFSTKDGNRFWPSREGLEETLHRLDTLQLTQPVGTTFQYSNINYMTAGLIVEKVSGQSYADYVTEHIFEPLGMQHSYAAHNPAQADGLAQGHTYMFGQTFSSDGSMPPSFLPTGFLITSAEDMTHYLIAHLNEGWYGENSVLSPQGMAELHEPAIPVGDHFYAMGWFVGTKDGITFMNHNGDAGRNHAIVTLVEERGFGVVLLANATGFVQQQQVDELSFMIVSNMVFGTPLEPISLPIGLRLQYWGILLAPLLQVLGMVFVWRKRHSLKALGVVLAVVLNLAVVVVLNKVSLTLITLPSMIKFYPDLGYGLVAIAILGITASIGSTLVYIKNRGMRKSDRL